MAHSSAKSLLALAARRSPEERLLPGRERSDTWPTEAGDGAGVFAVRMERLLPSAHGVFVEVAPTSTVGELKVQYLAALARETGGRGTSADVEAGRILALADSLELRLILDGAELRDEVTRCTGRGPRRPLRNSVPLLATRRCRCPLPASALETASLSWCGGGGAASSPQRSGSVDGGRCCCRSASPPVRSPRSHALSQAAHAAPPCSVSLSPAWRRVLHD